MNKKPGKTKPKPTVITLTLPAGNELLRSGTLLIQRGNLAKLKQFEYSNLGDIAKAIHAAMSELTMLEKFPPVIPDAVVDAASTPTSTNTDPVEETDDSDDEATEGMSEDSEEASEDASDENETEDTFITADDPLLILSDADIAANRATVVPLEVPADPQAQPSLF